MKKITFAIAATALLASPVMADDHAVKIGLMLGFTGGAESYAPPMAGGVKAALSEASESGEFLGGKTIAVVEADSGCDGQLGTAAAEKLITADGVAGIIGAICSGATTAALSTVAVPNGMVIFSPSATSPALSTIEDNGLFFRSTPSDARQGVVMAEILLENEINSVAVTYVNNDYGKGLADAFESAYKELGGEITISRAHEDNRGDYSAEVGTLAAAGGDLLVCACYSDTGGKAIIQAALDTGAFDRFHLPDAMVGNTIEDTFGDQLDGSMGQTPGSDGEGAALFLAIGEKAGFDATQAFSAESYDAAASMILAMQAADSINPAEYKEKIFEVTNAPGEEILPGELAKGLKLLAEGKDVDLVGASSLELVGPGDGAGSYRVIMTKGGKQETVGFR